MLLVLAFLGIFGIILSVVFGMMAIGARKPEIDLLGKEVDGNPTHLLIKPNLLTDQGKKYLLYFYISWGIFILSVILGGIISTI